jgi:flagellar biosynthesis/type III secretory pathway M-ring protein FliF/YscJ
MKTRIEELLEKYWETETSQSEEKELRDLILEAEGYEQEKALFGALNQFKAEEPKSLSIPKTKTKKLTTTWISWAASVTILLGSFWGWRVYERNQAEREAYEEVMLAFSMIQSNLSKGQDQLMPLNDLKYLNTTNQLFKLEEPTEK